MPYLYDEARVVFHEMIAPKQILYIGSCAISLDEIYSIKKAENVA